MKLKDEPDGISSAGSGLKRSHSSPNIAKMLQDGQRPDRSLPSVDRSSKPKAQADIRSMPAHTELSAAKVRNLQGQWGNVSCGLTGLRNLGNTCYMNSIIQTLSNTAPLNGYFLSDRYCQDINKDNILGKGGEIAEEYAVLVKALWSGQYRSIAPRDFKAIVSRHHELFAGYDQQDSQELLVFLMDSLHEDLNRVRKRHHLPEQKNDGISDMLAADRAWEMHKTVNQSIIVELFQGQFKSTVMCLMCRTKSVTFDTFMYLPLPIPASGRCSIKECLKQFLEEEKMTKESRWNCPHCKCKRDAVKNLDIWRLPPILLIHLKRFYMQGMWRDKINTYVDFPLEGLDLSQCLLGPQKNRGPYNLYAVSNHYGTMEGGHYTAFCKNANINKWFKFDDHEVYDIGNSDIKSSAAYILFYSSIKTQPTYR
ncbi:Ubiquitin carboxyl-terminal hydrolase 8 [Lamellibrachia satsuma]|nr:Ubiquitin carboxyl-terminal hydrolase 8 [Lamellibrachia satsuma]